MATELLDTPPGVGGKIDRNTGKALTTPPVPTTTALTSASLTPTPYFNVTPPQPSTAAAGFHGYMGATATQVAQEKAQADASKNDAFTAMLKSDTESGLTDKLYADSVDPANKARNDVNNKIVASQHAQQRELEALGSQGALTPAQKNAQTDAINRKYISEQADLAVTKYAADNDYYGAKEVADRAVTALMEKQKNQNAALMFNYQENKDLFTKDEQRLFETSQAERNRQLDNQEYRLRSEFDQKIKQSDPLYKAQLAKAQADAAKAIAEGKATASPLAMAQSSYTVSQVSDLAKNPALAGAVGPNIFARSGGGGLDQLTGAKQNFIGSVEQLRQQLTLDSLVNAKANGATFGALSEGELKLLSQSATKLDTWAIKGSDGKVTGYNANEADFKKELDKVNNFTKLDYILKGGDPASVDAKKLPDGTIWTQNSDGSFTQLQ